MSEPLPVIQLDPIDYENRAQTVRPMSPLTAKCVAAVSLVPTAVGLILLIGYRLTALGSLATTGFFWLLGGGTITFVIGVISLVNLIRAMSRRPRDETVVRCYAFGIVAGVVAVITAYVCATLGTHWMHGPHFHLTVVNATTKPIDSVIVHFDDGDVVVGPLPPGGSGRTGLLWYSHQPGPLEITTTAGGQSLRKADRQEFDNWSLSHGLGNKVELTVAVEPAELPKAAR